MLEGAFALLDALGGMGEAGLTELARAGNLPKATAYRLLEQMAALGVVEKRRARYRVGPRIFSVGWTWRPDPALLRAADTPIRQLARATGASVGIGVRAYNRVVLARAVPGATAREVPLLVGVPLPDSTAVAAALLAWEHTASPRLDAGRAADIRAGDLAYDQGSVLMDVSCVAAPIMAPNGPAGALFAVVGGSRPPRPLPAALSHAGAAIAAAFAVR